MEKRLKSGSMGTGLAVCLLGALLVLSALVFLPLIQRNFPPASYHYGEFITASFEGRSLRGAEGLDNLGRMTVTFGTPDGHVGDKQTEETVTLKEGCTYTRAYLRRLFPGEEIDREFEEPFSVRYVPYAWWEAKAVVLEIERDFMQKGGAYADFIFRLSGDIINDAELGPRVVLYVDSRDAQLIQNEIAARYGDIILWGSDVYTEHYFCETPPGQTWYKSPSPGYEFAYYSGQWDKLK